MSSQEYFNWKGKTLNQVISKIQLNKGNINDIYGPTPIKLYRREVASSNTDDVITVGNQRTSVKIDEINRPGGSIVVSNNTGVDTGIKNIIITESEENAVEEEKNSLKRVRNGKSSTIDGETDGEYFADTLQYLKNRGKTFEQNLTYTVKVENSSAYTNKLKFKTLTETVMSDSNTQNTDLLYAVPVENLKKKGGNPFPINSRDKLKKITGYIDETPVSETGIFENTIIQINRAFSFNSDNYITANNSGLTVCFWIYLNDNTGSEWIFNFSGYNNITQTLDLSIKKSNTNNILDPGIYGLSNNITTYFPVISYRRWYHIAISVSQGTNSKITYYLNGGNIGETSINFNVGTIVGIATFGNQGIFNSSSFITNAKFTDARLYDTVITGGNILSIYNRGLGTFETILYSNLLYQYRFFDTDYSVIGNNNYVDNFGLIQNTKGKILNNIEQTTLPNKLFYFDSSILPTVIGNQGMTVCFWARLINNSGNNYLFNFNGFINNSPINFSVKTYNDNVDQQIYIEINNSRTSYINITYNQIYLITVSLYEDVITQKINFIFIINSGAYIYNIPTQINNGEIIGLASLGRYVENSLLNSANAEYANARLYNTVLTGAEVNILYNKGIGTFNNIITAVPLFEYRFFTNDYSIQNGSTNKYVVNWGSLQNKTGLLCETTTNLSSSYNLLTSYKVNTLDNKSFSLNGNYDVSFVNTGITVCFWVYPIAMDISSSDWYFNFKGIIGGTNEIGFSVKTTNDSITNPGFYVESNDVILNSPVAYYNSWNHITITGYESDNSPLKFYFNGEYVENIQSQYTTGDISGVFQLGNSYTTNVLKSYCANAKYTDVRLYNTVLQGVEIRQLYNFRTGTDAKIRDNSILYQYLFNQNDFNTTNNITFVNNRATSAYVGTSGMVIPEPPVYRPLFSTGKALFDCKWVNRSYTGPIFKLIDFSSNYPLSSFPIIDTMITSVINDGFNNLIDTNGNVILGKLQDFYVDSSNGIITTSPNGMGVALNDWLSLGGDKIYVDIWYDQTGNNNNATTNNSSLYARKYYDVDVNNQLKYIPYMDTSYNKINFFGTKFFTLQNGTVPYGKSSYTVSTKLSNINGRGDFLSSGNFQTNIYNNFSTNTFKGEGRNTTNLYCNYWDLTNFFLSSQSSFQSNPINQGITFIYDGSNVVFNPNDLNNNYYKTNVYVDKNYDISSNVYDINTPTVIDGIIQPLFSDISGVRIERTTREIIINNNNSNDTMNYRFNFIGANRVSTNYNGGPLGGTFRLSYYSGIINYMWIGETALDDTERGIIENLGSS